MTIGTASTRSGRIVLVATALVIALLADLAVGASWPGRIAVFGLAATAVLVIGAKSVVAPAVSRPAGTRVGELGNPLDDLDEAIDADTDTGDDRNRSEADRA